MGKNPPANAEDTRETGLIPGSERSLEKEVATCSSVLAWKIPHTESVGLHSQGRKEVDST